MSRELQNSIAYRALSFFNIPKSPGNFLTNLNGEVQLSLQSEGILFQDGFQLAFGSQAPAASWYQLLMNNTAVTGTAQMRVLRFSYGTSTVLLAGVTVAGYLAIRKPVATSSIYEQISDAFSFTTGQAPLWTMRIPHSELMLLDANDEIGFVTTNSVGAMPAIGWQMQYQALT